MITAVRLTSPAQLLMPLAAGLVIATVQVAFGLGGAVLTALAPAGVGLATWRGGRGVGIAMAVATAVLAGLLVPDTEIIPGVGLRTLLFLVAFGQLLLTAVLAAWMRDVLRAASEARLGAERAAQQGEEQLAMATHELRMPLTSLYAYARLAAAQLRTDPRGAAEANAMVVHEARQATQLVTKLLGSTVARRGAIALDRARVDLSEIARAALATVGPAAEGRHELHSVMSPRAPVMGDPIRLEELLVNLLENALKYSPDGTRIDMLVTIEGDKVVARVRDRGPGISTADHSRIFERFYRVRPETSGGLGVGLYVAREMARAHGGDLAIEPTNGPGSTFALTLPRETEDVAVQARTNDHTQSPRRVLLVEDDEGVREAVEASLHFAGHEFRAASTSVAALTIAEDWHPDVILLDRLRGSQPEFASTYGARPGPHAPILALSAAWDAERWARSVGAVAMIPKPFEVDELLESIERYGRHSEFAACRTRSA